MRSRIIKAAIGILAAFGLVTGVGATAASAAISIGISGSVACQNGAAVTGIWVSSSGGGSGWAARSARSGAAWINDYTFTINSSGTSTTVELHIGCGGSTSTWASNNKFKLGTLSSSVARSTICNDQSGVTNYTCRAWNTNQVLVGMPFTGRLSADLGTHPKWSGHDVAQDAYAVPGTAAAIWAFAPRGVPVTIKAAQPTTGVCGAINITVTAGGVQAGTVHFGHLVPKIGAGTLANGAVIGTTYRWPYMTYNGTCGWEVRDDNGVHTHMALTSTNAWACFATYTSRPGGRWVGMIGKTPATAARAACPMK